jgi:voltage-gated potassium channel
VRTRLRRLWSSLLLFLGAIVSMREGWRRLWVGFVLVACVIAIGTVGFRVIGVAHDVDWPWWDCLYMTVITISTVGYGEILPIQEIVPARILVIVLILFGMGTLLFFASSVVSLVVEGNVKETFRRTKMRRSIEELEDHIIVCGVGTTGVHVVEELAATKTAFVAIDKDRERIEWMEAHLGAPFPHVVGDATEDDVLVSAGIGRARGVVAALSSDKDNLFVVVSARGLNGKLRIISRAKEVGSGTKLKKAGADAVVSPNFIGGMRMVSEMIRPEVVEFLDLMLRNRDKTLRIEEVQVLRDSDLVRKSLKETDLRKISNLLVIAARDKAGRYHYNPRPDFVLEEGTTLIVLGETDDVVKLRKQLKLGTYAPPP